MTNVQVKIELPDLDKLDESAQSELKRELEVQLMRSLAAYVLLRRRDPVCVLLDDLFHLESQAGQFLGEAIKDQAIKSKMHGSLSGVLSMIPIPTKGLRS